MKQDGLFSASDRLLRQLLSRFIALHLFSVQQEVLFEISSLRKFQTGLEMKDCQLLKKIGLPVYRYWRATQIGFTQWPSRQMAASWPPGQKTAQCGCGMQQPAQRCRRWRAIQIGFAQWPSRQMAASWPQGQQTAQCGCGMQ